MLFQQTYLFFKLSDGFLTILIWIIKNFEKFLFGGLFLNFIFEIANLLLEFGDSWFQARLVSLELQNLALGPLKLLFKVSDNALEIAEALLGSNFFLPQILDLFGHIF